MKIVIVERFENLKSMSGSLMIQKNKIINIIKLENFIIFRITNIMKALNIFDS